MEVARNLIPLWFTELQYEVEEGGLLTSGWIKFRKLGNAFVVSTVLMVSACLESEVPTQPSNQDDSHPTHYGNFAPLKAGNLWVYERKMRKGHIWDVTTPYTHDDYTGVEDSISSEIEVSLDGEPFDGGAKLRCVEKGIRVQLRKLTYPGAIVDTTRIDSVVGFDVLESGNELEDGQAWRFFFRHTMPANQFIPAYGELPSLGAMDTAGMIGSTDHRMKRIRYSSSYVGSGRVSVRYSEWVYAPDTGLVSVYFQGNPSESLNLVRFEKAPE
jgi:hypothetical protein